MLQNFCRLESPLHIGFINFANPVKENINKAILRKVCLMCHGQSVLLRSRLLYSLPYTGRVRNSVVLIMC